MVQHKLYTPQHDKYLYCENAITNHNNYYIETFIFKTILKIFKNWHIQCQDYEIAVLIPDFPDLQFFKFEVSPKVKTELVWAG